MYQIKISTEPILDNFQRPYEEETLIRMEEVEFFIEDDEAILLRRAINAWKKGEEKVKTEIGF